jgi:hypothetical protein
MLSDAYRWVHRIDQCTGNVVASTIETVDTFDCAVRRGTRVVDDIVEWIISIKVKKGCIRKCRCMRMYACTHTPHAANLKGGITNTNI